MSRRERILRAIADCAGALLDADGRMTPERRATFQGVAAGLIETADAGGPANNRQAVAPASRAKQLMEQPELDESEIIELAAATGVVLDRESWPYHNRTIDNRRIWSTREIVRCFRGQGITRHRAVLGGHPHR